MTTWKAGQRVLVVPAGTVPPFAARIRKVGHVWVTLEGSHGRFHRRSSQLDGGYRARPVGRVYPSQEAYLQDLELRLAWESLRRDVAAHYAPPAGVSVADVEAARRLLLHCMAVVGG